MISEKGFEKGVYDFPVVFQIPDGIPGSFVQEST